MEYSKNPQKNILLYNILLTKGIRWKDVSWKNYAFTTTTLTVSYIRSIYSKGLLIISGIHKTLYYHGSMSKNKQ